MATHPIQRPRWDSSEVLAQLGWTLPDLRAAIITGQLTPSYYINAAVGMYAIDTQGKLQKMPPAVFKNGWFYARRFEQTSAIDGRFTCFSDTADPLVEGTVVYVPIEKNLRGPRVVKLSDVLEHGSVTDAELAHFKSSLATPKPPSIAVARSGPLPQWWNIEYELIDMANAEKEKRTDAGYGMVQRGTHAGRHSLSGIAAALSHRIREDEKISGTNRQIGDKTIENYLRRRGWH